jgi:hypothetical protein
MSTNVPSTSTVVMVAGDGAPPRSSVTTTSVICVAEGLGVSGTMMVSAITASNAHLARGERDDQGRDAQPQGEEACHDARCGSEMRSRRGPEWPRRAQGNAEVSRPSGELVAGVGPLPRPEQVPHAL